MRTPTASWHPRWGGGLSALNAAQAETSPEALLPSRQVSSITGRGDERWAGDVWVRPLSDGSFVFVLVNRDPLAARRMSILFGDGGDGSGCDLFDSSFDHARVGGALVLSLSASL